jgi:hypothetical protein
MSFFFKIRLSLYIKKINMSKWQNTPKKSYYQVIFHLKKVFFKDFKVHFVTKASLYLWNLHKKMDHFFRTKVPPIYPI